MSNPAFAALQEVAQRHALPERYAQEHLRGFAMDAHGREYITIDDALEYCYHVAGVVGLMMAMIMGAKGEATLDRACDLGLAFQLSNIARDIVEDARNDRCYLPAQWLSEEGVPRKELALPAHRPAVARLAARLVDLAEPYYAYANQGLPALPLRSAWAIATARGVYREIGIQVKARGAPAWDQRVSTRSDQRPIRGSVKSSINFGNSSANPAAAGGMARASVMKYSSRICGAMTNIAVPTLPMP